MKYKQFAKHPRYPGYLFDKWSYSGKDNKYMHLSLSNHTVFESQHFGKYFLGTGKVLTKNVTFVTKLVASNKFERYVQAIWRKSVGKALRGIKRKCKRRYVKVTSAIGAYLSTWRTSTIGMLLLHFGAIVASSIIAAIIYAAYVLLFIK